MGGPFVLGKAAVVGGLDSEVVNEGEAVAVVAENNDWVVVNKEAVEGMAWVGRGIGGVGQSWGAVAVAVAGDSCEAAGDFVNRVVDMVVDMAAVVGKAAGKAAAAGRRRHKGAVEAVHYSGRVVVHAGVYNFVAAPSGCENTMNRKRKLYLSFQSAGPALDPPLKKAVKDRPHASSVIRSSLLLGCR